MDDVILTGAGLEEIKNLKAFLHNQFRIKDLEKLHYSLGLEVFNKANGVINSQKMFATNLLKEHDCLGYLTLFSSL